MLTWVASDAGSSFPQGGFAFTVHSVFARALNLRPEGGQPLLSFVAEPSQTHPRAALIQGAEFTHWGLQPRSPGHFDGQRLSFDSGVEVVMPGTRRRAQAEAACPAPRQRRPRLWVASGLVQAATEARGGPLLPGFEPQLAAASRQLRCAVDQRSVPRALEAWSSLLGLGPGLTPAADDFLCGLWAGLSAQALEEPELRVFLAEFAQAFDARLLAATNDISAAFVAEAVEGRFGTALVAFADAALGATDGLDEAVEALAGLGATSGLDAARGFLFAFEHEIGGCP